MIIAKANADKICEQLRKNIDQLSSDYFVSNGLVNELSRKNQSMALEIETIKNELKKSEALVFEQNIKINSERNKASVNQQNSLSEIVGHINILQNSCDKYTIFLMFDYYVMFFIYC